jgi:hypothetical protein
MEPAGSSNFNLEKLYLDLIDDNGNCFVLYSAKLKAGLIRINYSGLIFSDSDGMTIEKSSLSKLDGTLINDLLIFNNPLLKVTGNWLQTEKPFSSLLYNDEINNELTWNCHHPKALAEVTFRDKTYKGFGYAETLTLGIKPWKLPIDELRWGRFLSDNYAITWINWKGSHPLNKIFCNGVEYNDPVFEPERIVFGKGVYILTFLQPAIVRKGKLASLFSNMPWLKVIFTSRTLNIVELKYKAKSTFTGISGIHDTGWALYEVVTWDK